MSKSITMGALTRLVKRGVDTYPLCGDCWWKDDCKKIGSYSGKCQAAQVVRFLEKGGYLDVKKKDGEE